jgi:hypothetical protein
MALLDTGKRMSSCGCEIYFYSPRRDGTISTEEWTLCDHEGSVWPEPKDGGEDA